MKLTHFDWNVSVSISALFIHIFLCSSRAASLLSLFFFYFFLRFFFIFSLRLNPISQGTHFYHFIHIYFLFQTKTEKGEVFIMYLLLSSRTEHKRKNTHKKPGGFHRAHHDKRWNRTLALQNDFISLFFSFRSFCFFFSFFLFQFRRTF